MKLLRTLLTAVAVWAASSFASLAQTSPNWTYGFVPTTAQWNALWASKQDFLGAPPLLTTGGTMTGPLVTAASIAATAGLNIPPGVAPSSPNNGDVWTTTVGVFARINGVTYQLATSSGGPLIVTSNSNNALAVGANGATNPVFQVNASASSVATGLQIFGQAAGSGLFVTAISSATNENMSINAKGSGAINIGGISTGTISLGNALSSILMQSPSVILTGASSTSLVVGPNGTTNPTLTVDDSTASAATGLLVKSAAAGAGIALSALSSAINENETIDAKGSGSVKIGTVSTGGFGFNVGSDATGDTYYRGAGGVLIRVPLGSNTQVWTISGGVPTWQPAAAASITVGTTTVNSCGASTNILFNNAGVLGCEALVPAANGGTGAASPTAHSLLIAQGSSAMTNTGAGSAGQFAGVASGASDPSFLSGPRTLIKTTSPPANITVTFTNGSAVITAANSYVAGQSLQFTTTGTLPTNFSTSTNYIVLSTGLSSSQFEVAVITSPSTPISAGSAGSGTQTAVAAGVVDASSFTSTFNEYEVIIENCTWSVGTGILMYLNIGGSWQAANYKYSVGGPNTAGTFGGSGSTSASSLQINNSGTTTVISDWMELSQPSQTSSPKMIKGRGVANDTSNFVSYEFGGFYNGGNGALSGITIATSSAPSANTSCTMKVYGWL